ncbi:MAG: peptide-methionine (S)-S-oxide reductase MsrA [Gemmatimonadaceae bacterium]|nr:peptide-methionine (S)-S-oxide reductase MsrA [Gemmatimonadaceae bacterium]
MLPPLLRLLAAAPMAVLLGCGSAAAASSADATVPEPMSDAPSIAIGTQTAVFAGGCFWGVDAVFRHVKGVTGVVSGYAGGTRQTAMYEEVGTGTTGHAEAVEVTYDPAVVSYGTLLKVFFTIAHDPTQLNRQGPDVGSHYRSAIFFANDAQRTAAVAYIAELGKARVFRQPIVTSLEPLHGFFAAEAYHQDYLAQHPDQPYIVLNDLPKLELLKRRLPELFTGN